MSKDNEVYEEAIQLRRDIRKVLADFVEGHKDDYTIEDFFKVLSVALSSVTSEAAYLLFKKNMGTQKAKEWIGQIMEFAQSQLDEFYEHKDTGIQ